MNTVTGSTPGLPAYEDILAARTRIAGHVHRTPVLTSSHINGRAGAELFFKCENLQKTGAFKARGALNAVLGLDPEQAARGVATHSSGNHGAALSYAARIRGISATVVMPDNSAAAKKAAVRDYGGHIIECRPGQPTLWNTVSEFMDSSGAAFVHPYDDARVIAGQATCAMELLEDTPGLDCIITPVGGGGLISGTCLAAAGAGSEVRIFGAEPANADDAVQSFRAGERILQGPPDTIADGLRANLGELTWRCIQSHVTDMLPVSEADIVAAMKLVWERMKLIIEPSSAVAVAALLGNAEQFRGRRVGVIISGGNVDLEALPWNS